jgi:hypothetical protein
VDCEHRHEKLASADDDESKMSSADVAVVYLARAASGIEPVQRFLHSYERHSAGAPHALHVICKGWASIDLVAAEFSRAGLSPTFLPMSDEGVDVPAYMACVPALAARVVCFLNSFSEILADGWLSKLLEGLSDPSVGICGATGSFESATSLHLRQAAREWRVIVKHPKELRTRAHALARMLLEFPLHPNPHIRTNAFVVRTELFKSLSLDGTDKAAALQFESGVRSMTRQLQALRLGAVVVGANGRIYSKDEWPASATFRCANQDNLLIGDNQTRRYQDAGQQEREFLGTLAWRRLYRVGN